MLVFNETELQLLYIFNLVEWDLHNELFYKFRAGWKEETQGCLSWNANLGISRENCSDSQMLGELLHHGRRVGDDEMTKIRVVSGETNLKLHIETPQL